MYFLDCVNVQYALVAITFDGDYIPPRAKLYDEILHGFDAMLI